MIIVKLNKRLSQVYRVQGDVFKGDYRPNVSYQK